MTKHVEIRPGMVFLSQRRATSPLTFPRITVIVILEVFDRGGQLWITFVVVLDNLGGPGASKHRFHQPGSVHYDISPSGWCWSNKDYLCYNLTGEDPSVPCQEGDRSV